MSRRTSTDVERGPPFGAVAEALALGMPYQVRVPDDGATRCFTYVGESCLRLNGITAQAVMADPNLLYDMILPEHRQRFDEAEAEALALRRPFCLEIAMRRADGEVRWHRISSAPRVIEGGTLWDGLQTDITRAKCLAEQLDWEKRRLEMAVEATGLGLWELDLRADKITWSERNKALFGLPPDAEIDVPSYLGMLHHEDREVLRDAYMAAYDAGGGDFRVEHRVVTPQGEIRWLLTHGRIVRDEEGPRLVVGTSVDITGQKSVEERRNLLIGELAHRGKNGIAVVISMVHQTARTAETVEAFEQALIARLQAMADSQDLVTATAGRPVQLSGIIDRVLSPFDLRRFDITPEVNSVAVPGDIAVSLALLLHEMATNAVKYGALANDTGRVAVSCCPDGPQTVVLCWRERGGPEVDPSPRHGFGARLLQSALRPQGGHVDFSFEPEGFRARLEFRRGG